MDGKRYDGSQGGYATPNINADDLFQEEFHDNAFGDDLASDSDDDTDEQGSSAGDTLRFGG